MRIKRPAFANTFVQDIFFALISLLCCSVLYLFAGVLCSKFNYPKPPLHGCALLFACINKSMAPVEFTYGLSNDRCMPPSNQWPCLPSPRGKQHYLGSWHHCRLVESPMLVYGWRLGSLDSKDCVGGKVRQSTLIYLSRAEVDLSLNKKLNTLMGTNVWPQSIRGCNVVVIGVAPLVFVLISVRWSVR